MTDKRENHREFLKSSFNTLDTINSDNKTKEYSLTMEDSLAALFIEMQQFFTVLGYQVPGDFPSLCFLIFSSMDPDRHGILEAFEDAGPLIKPLLVKKQSESDSFLKDYYRFIRTRKVSIPSNKKKKLNVNKFYAESQLESLLKEEENQKKNLDSLKKKLNKTSCISKKTAEKMEKSISEIENSYQAAFGSSKMYKELRNLHFIAAGDGQLTKQQLDMIKKELKKGLLSANKDRNFSKLLKVIGEQEKLSKKIKAISPEIIKEKIERKEEKLEDIQSEKENIQNQLDKIFENIDQTIKMINKNGESVHHREVFQKYNAHNAVQSDFDGIPFLEKRFEHLTAEEKEDIRDYITENARKFRTRISRNIRTIHRDDLDMGETIKKACATNGIPIRLSYKKPKKQKARLLMFLDVSGSCREASEMMLNFMYQMQEVFPGGCKSYAFVNSLYDISAMFDSRNETEALTTILDAIPRRGVYSDYGTPIKDFYENHMAEISKDTLIFWIGDARNNKRAAYPDYFKAMSRKAKKVFWLNTEDVTRWNINDSIIDVYRPYCDTVKQVTTTKELLTFLLDVK